MDAADKVYTKMSDKLSIPHSNDVRMIFVWTPSDDAIEIYNLECFSPINV